MVGVPILFLLGLGMIWAGGVFGWFFAAAIFLLIGWRSLGVLVRAKLKKLTVSPSESIYVENGLSKTEVRLQHADVQAINVNEPFFARLFGCAELQLGSGASDKMEIVVIGISKKDAEAARSLIGRGRQDAVGK